MTGVGSRALPSANSPRARVRALLPSDRRGWLVVAAVLLVVLGAAVTAVTLLGGSDPEPPAAPGVAASSEAAPPVDDLPAELAALTGVEGDARDALAAWGRPDLSYGAWWGGLRERLAPGARADYQDTDPTALPDLTLEALDVVRPGPSDDTKTVFFDTSAGRFGVDMSRRPSSTTWLATRVLFPGQESSLR